MDEFILPAIKVVAGKSEFFLETFVQTAELAIAFAATRGGVRLIQNGQLIDSIIMSSHLYQIESVVLKNKNDFWGFSNF